MVECPYCGNNQTIHVDENATSTLYGKNKCFNCGFIWSPIIKIIEYIEGYIPKKENDGDYNN